MLNNCKYSTSYVCKCEKDREVFESILKTVNPNLHVCEHVIYVVTNSKGQKFRLFSLDYASKSPRGYYVRDMYTSGYIYLNKDNLEVICTKGRRCEKTFE